MEGQIFGTDGFKTADGKECYLVATIQPAATTRNPAQHAISIMILASPCGQRPKAPLWHGSPVGLVFDRYWVLSTPEQHWLDCRRMIDKLSTQLSGVSTLLPIKGWLTLVSILRSHDEKTCDTLLARISGLGSDFWSRYLEQLRSMGGATDLHFAFKELLFFLARPWDKRQALTVNQLRKRTEGARKQFRNFRTKLLDTFAADISLRELVTLAHGEVGSGAFPSNIPDTTLAELLDILVKKFERDLAYIDQPDGVPITYNRGELKAHYREQVKSGEMFQQFESVKNIASGIERKPEEYSEETREAYRLRLRQISEWEKDPGKWIEHMVGGMYDRPLDFTGQWTLSRDNDGHSGNNTWETETLAYERLIDHFCNFTGGPKHKLAREVMVAIFGAQMKSKDLEGNYKKRHKSDPISKKNK